MSTPHLHDRAVAFMAFLQRYAADRGALANLRGALSDARRHRAWPLLGGFPGAIGNPAFETVAALWAGDPAGDRPNAGNLGDTLHSLAKENKSFEGRVKRLLTCDRDEIAERVAPLVRAARAKGVKVNYARLLSDLLWWNDRVQVEWAKAFWGVGEPADAIALGMLDPPVADSADPASASPAKEAHA
ncbi:MAG: CRISPR-associated protein Cse2 [Lentisphaerae bacterium ADurb.BinA184]|nr:MAG: CRISPR-associated protein Cse2 [Lentisphaerae bacterium ADurb.BinA184]